MRKLLFFVLICAASGQLKAQTEKSTLMLGGEVLLLSQTDNTVFTASPNIGVFFADNFAAGAEVSLITGNGSSIWGVGPYVRGYFGGSDKGKLFAQVGVEIAGISGSGGSSTAFTPRAGYAVFLNRSIALEIAARLITGQGSTIFGAGAGFQIHLK